MLTSWSNRQNSGRILYVILHISCIWFWSRHLNTYIIYCVNSLVAKWCGSNFIHDCMLNRLIKAQIKENIKAPCHWPLWPVNSPHKGPVTRKKCPSDDAIMVRIYSIRYLPMAGAYGNERKLSFISGGSRCVYLYPPDKYSNINRVQSYLHLWYTGGHGVMGQFVIVIICDCVAICDWKCRNLWQRQNMHFNDIYSVNCDKYVAHSSYLY